MEILRSHHDERSHAYRFFIIHDIPESFGFKLWRINFRVHIKKFVKQESRTIFLNDGNFWFGACQRRTLPLRSVFASHVNSQPTSSCFHSNLIKDVRASSDVVFLEVVELSDDSGEGKTATGKEKFADNGGTSGSLGGKHYSLEKLPCLAFGAI